jgi:hypothetical protein
MGDADVVSDGRATARSRWRDQRLGDLASPRRRSWAVVPVVLWGGAAVLAAVAPFLQLFVVTPTGGERSFDGIDGWGRVNPALALHTHEPRFGIALWVCALGIVWPAVQRGRSVRRADPGLDPVTAVAAVGVPCLLAGVTGGLLLFVQSYTSQLSARLAGGFHVRWSWGVWLSLASLVLGVAATAILFWPARAGAPADGPER